jgi:hypothetical protein
MNGGHHLADLEQVLSIRYPKFMKPDMQKNNRKIIVTYRRDGNDNSSFYRLSVSCFYSLWQPP